MLETYVEKRDFHITPEPAAKPGAPAATGPLRFVVQKHAARRAHYDLRLEIGGALKSWAVPKGPSLDPAEKRLAVMVEDHPLDYASFEGTIPKGEYGAGEVIVWDNGVYAPDEPPGIDPEDRAAVEAAMRRGLEAGKLAVTFHGHKLQGSWALVRIKPPGNNWLLIKHKDMYADASRDLLLDDRSVLSSRSIAELRAGQRSAGLSASNVPGRSSGTLAAPFPDKLAPMLPTLADGAFSHPNWLFEPKLDGVRTMAFLRKSSVELVSRGQRNVTSQYPALAQDLGRAQEHDLVLDGEIVALDSGGRPSFQRLQERLNLSRAADIRGADHATPVTYYAFDLIYADGYDLRRVQLEERQRLLRLFAPLGPWVQLVESFAEDGETAYQAFLGFGLEGMIAKRKDSVYEPGRRVQTWLKIKGTRSDDFVIAGFTDGTGARSATFGSLVLGSYDEGGSLVLAGHVGTGFDDAALRRLRGRLDELAVEECPLPEIPVSNAPQHWVRPELVAEVRFSQWTDDGRLREPVFARLREDKAPQEAIRAEVAPVPGVAPVGRGRVAGRAAVPNGAGREGTGPSHTGRKATRELTDPPGELATDSPDVDRLLQQIEEPKEKLQVEIDGSTLDLTNLSKVLWPAADGASEVTKRDLIRHLLRVSPYLLSHLQNRPLTLVRCPDGMTGERFYQKHIERGLPTFVETVRLYSEQGVGDGDYLLCNNLATLVWLGQIAALELHPWYSRISPDPDGHHLGTEFAGSEENIESSLLNYPDFVVFDLDPYMYSGREAKGEEPELNPDAYARTVEVAYWLKELLDGLSLTSFVKTSGRTGLHLFVPIFRTIDYTATRAACETIGRFLLRAHPKVVTMEWTVSKRTGKIFLDHNQNVRGKTLASIFSPRLSPGAPVSMPLRWEELPEVYPTDFTVFTAGNELARRADSWADILESKVDLEALLGAVRVSSHVFSRPSDDR